MLTDKQCGQLEKLLTEAVEPRKIAAYLCLHMGLTVAEATALKLIDIDVQNGELTLRRTLTRRANAGRDRFELLELDKERVLPMPPQVRRLFIGSRNMYKSEDCFLVSGDDAVPGMHLIQNLLASLNNKYSVSDSLTPLTLRSTFIRRCLESGVDLYTLGDYIGVHQLSELQKRYCEYIKPRTELISALDTTVTAQEAGAGRRRMSLLILGAGGQGAVVAEIARAIGLFEEIAFLDDDPEKARALAPCGDCARFVRQFPIALPSVGESGLRMKWINMLVEAGFIVPTLIDPTATVSPSAEIGFGTLIEPKVTIGANAKIGVGCIISSGAIIGRDVEVPDGTHIQCGDAVRSS